VQVFLPLHLTKQLNEIVNKTSDFLSRVTWLLISLYLLNLSVKISITKFHNEGHLLD